MTSAKVSVRDLQLVMEATASPKLLVDRTTMIPLMPVKVNMQVRDMNDIINNLNTIEKYMVSEATRGPESSTIARSKTKPTLVKRLQ